MMKEYVVTLKKIEDLDSFYRDMETESSIQFIPQRPVELVKRRNKSRNTHYFLTEEESKSIINDARVLAVNLSLSESNLFVKPSWNQSENWNKNSGLIRDHRNWGLFRCSFGEQILDWGSDGTSAQSGSINVSYDASNVDIVIVDGHFKPDHPEFTVNPDGTGQSRVIQYNWFQHEPNISGGAVSSYPYPTTNAQYSSVNNNHGCHVAGIAGGNSNGWARNANLYNITPFGATVVPEQLFEYIREFHNSKNTNPSTGVKNPTIVNNSWNFVQNIDITEIISVNYRGNTIPGPFSIVDTANLIQYGLVNSANGVYSLGAIRADIAADLEDCVSNGIIFVGAVPDNGFKIDVPGGVDYDNYIQTASSNLYYHRGASPVTDVAPDNSKLTVSVGAIDSLKIENKANSSATGPRVDVFAPGYNIMSSVNSPFGYGGITDYRNPNFYIVKASGTSQAAAQATGVIASWLGQYPSANLQNVFSNLTSNLSVSGQVYNSNTDVTAYGDGFALLGASNAYLKADFVVASNGYARGTLGVVYPAFKYLPRSGQVRYPRFKTKLIY